MPYATTSAHSGGMDIQTNRITASGQAIQHVGHNIEKQFNYYGRITSLLFYSCLIHVIKYFKD